MKKLFAILSVLMIITLSACNNTAKKEECVTPCDSTQVDTVIAPVVDSTVVK
jgi:pyrimidine deaminase RibD-like protein